MASRLFQMQYKYERDTVNIHMTVTIGATGAPTLVTGLNKGIVSMDKLEFIINEEEDFKIFASKMG